MVGQRLIQGSPYIDLEPGGISTKGFIEYGKHAEQTVQDHATMATARDGKIKAEEDTGR